MKNYRPVPPTQIMICADDFGLSPAVSNSILDLAKIKRVSAISCIVNFPNEIKDFQRLRKLKGVDVGLHFTMTDFVPLSKQAKSFFNNRFPNSNKLFAQSLCRSIPEKLIECELKVQYQALTDLLGRQPDYIDGHHHIHQYPGIAHIIANFSSELTKESHNVYVRTTSDLFHSILYRKKYALKSLFLSLLGKYLSLKLKKVGVPTNTSFSGVYNFSDSDNYVLLFKSMLKKHQNNGLIMCHPGEIDEQLKARDCAVTSRPIEYLYLRSQEFISDLKNNNIIVSRFIKLE
jgi:predicted glycoside hydrolase/deacetylase ChbG (UPF0249 family)